MLDDQSKMLIPVLAYDLPYEKQIMSPRLILITALQGKPLKTRRE